MVMLAEALDILMATVPWSATMTMQMATLPILPPMEAQNHTPADGTVVGAKVLAGIIAVVCT
jgi:hypothetical protein